MTTSKKEEEGQVLRPPWATGLQTHPVANPPRPPGAQLAGRAAIAQRSTVERSACKPRPETGRLPTHLHFDGHLLASIRTSPCSPPLYSLLALRSRPWPGRAAVGRDGPDAPSDSFLFFVCLGSPSEAPWCSWAPLQMRPPFSFLCFCFSLPWKLLGLQQGILQSRPHFGELRAFTQDFCNYLFFFFFLLFPFFALLM